MFELSRAQPTFWWTPHHIQKRNARSSTERKINGADDNILKISWTKKLAEHQDWDTKCNVILRDNASAIYNDRFIGTTIQLTIFSSTIVSLQVSWFSTLLLLRTLMMSTVLNPFKVSISKDCEWDNVLMLSTLSLVWSRKSRGDDSSCIITELRRVLACMS